MFSIFSDSRWIGFSFLGQDRSLFALELNLFCLLKDKIREEELLNIFSELIRKFNLVKKTTIFLIVAFYFMKSSEV